MALNVPDIDSEIGIMHTLFALEDLQGLKIDRLDGEVCLRLDRNRGAAYISHAGAHDHVAGDGGKAAKRRNFKRRI